jgi:hypothetical protein
LGLVKQKTKRELLDVLDLEKQEAANRSKTLRDAIESNRRKAAELISEKMDDAAKRWLAGSLLFKQLRSEVEKTMADLEVARIQLATQPDRPSSQTLEKITKVLRESATEKERTSLAINRMSYITQVGVDQATSELEGYGVKDRELDEEFRRLKGKEGAASSEAEAEETDMAELPEVPKKKSVTKQPSKEKA